MKKNYMLTLFLVCCAAFFGFSQNCSTLAITNTVDGSVCGPGSVTLEATSSGTGDDIYWYDAATNGTYLGSGSTFQTPVISSTTSYWATEVIATGTTENVGPLDPSLGTANVSSLNNHGLNFTVLSQINLVSVDIFPTAAVGTSGTIEIRDGSSATSGTIVATVPYTTTVSGSTSAPVAQTVILNVSLQPGTYTLTPGIGINLIRNTTGASYPYTSSAVEITGNTFNVNYYYWFYNWTVSTGSVTCESTPREEVIATVNNAGDEIVTSLPYTDTDDTANFANNYSGAPGSHCGATDNYLDGNEVIYEYTATADYIMTAELTNLTASETSIFVYESCSDIGTDCYAGIINENSGTYDLQFSVVNGQTYYIMISSSATTGAFSYTFNLDGVLCTNYPAPTGPATQDFIDGQTLASLDVTGSDLTWYSDAALTTVIPDDTVMVDNTPYYVTQSFGTCESPALTITVNEVQCSVLSIVSSQGASVCGEGVVELQATGAEQAVDTRIWWYENATGGNPIGKGNVFTTPEIASTTSFWVSEVAATGSVLTGQGQPTSSGTLSTTTNGGIILDVTQQMTLIDAEVFSTSAAGGVLNVELRDINNGNATVASASATMPAGGTSAAPISVVVPLNFNIAPGQYRLVKVSGPTFRYESGSFPDPLGTYGSVTGGATATGTSTLQYVFYNLTIGDEQAICESSPRTEVIATVNNAADIVTTNPLPYVNTNSTGAFANNYSGTPGTDCNATGNYLGGNDVVYEYVADTDRVVKIGLSAITGNDASVFVYENCSEIGNTCLAGAVNAGSSADFAIDEFTVYAGESYFILVSGNGAPMSIDYTLTIEEAMINCADYTAGPTVDSPEFFDPGDTLDDLEIEGGNLTFYSDASGATVLPGTTPAQDGTTYYVSQTLNGCVSDIVAVTVEEVVCSVLDITASTGDSVPCVGSATLTATASGNGNEIYWYENQTGGNPLSTGGTFQTPEITSTTSYWVAEAIATGMTVAGQAKPAPTATTTTTLTNYGLQFNVTQPFTLVSVEVYATSAGSMDLELRDASGAVLETATVSVSGTGGTSTPETLVLNMPIPIGNGLRLVKASAGAPTMLRESSGNTYPYPIGTFGEITGGTLNQGGDLTAYYWFYNWTVSSGEIICESPREEVIATVDTNGDIQVTTLPYTDANNDTANYGDPYEGVPGNNCNTTENYLNGNDVVYKFTAPNTELVDILLSDLTDFYASVFVYDSCGDLLDNCLAGAVAGPSDDDFGIEDFQVTAGEDYYIVISSWLTSTVGYTLDIIPFDCANLSLPDADTPQDFVGGDTLVDLGVDATENGATLNWYAGPGATNPIPDTTPLVDNTTYYVTQTFNGCESDPLAILVEELDCSALDVVSVTDSGAVSCQGEVTFTATASGNGNEIYWYDAATDGNVVGTGSTFTTPTLTNTTSYWAAEVSIDGGAGGSSPELIHYQFDTGNTITNSASSPVGNNPAAISGLTVGGTGLVGTALQGSGASSSSNVIDTGWNAVINGSFTIAFWTSNVPSSGTLYYIFGDSGANGFRCFTNGAAGANNWLIRGGGLPDLTAAGAATMAPNMIHFVYDATAGTYTAYIDGTQVEQVSVSSVPNETGTGFTVGGYASNSGLNGLMDEFRWYNRALTPAEVQSSVGAVGGNVVCESTRTEVVATVNQTGDVQVSYTDLPYNTTDSTAIYGNNFEGDPGADCPGAAYLDGNEVVYQYTADPVNDDILQIELSGITNPNTGMYIYTSCGDVGTNCLTGVTNEDSPSAMTISDYYINAGETIFIVISSESATVNYTLDIYGFDCATAPLVDVDPAPYFILGDNLSDVDIVTDPNSTTFTWYTDVALTMPVVDPTTETLVNGTTYYVTQTILGCESVAVAVTVVEFDCNAMAIQASDDVAICAPGGQVTLNAQSTGIGYDVYWYDAATGGDVVGIGSTLQVDVATTTSFWASEVYLGDFSQSGGYGMLNPQYGFGSTLINRGVVFEATKPFTLVDVQIFSTSSGGEIGIGLFDSSNNEIASTTFIVPGGGSTSNPIPATVPLNFDIPAPGEYRLLRTTNTVSMSYEFNTTNYPYPLGSSGQLITGATSVSATNDSYNYYFYNWTIAERDLLCESTREEVVVTVNNQPTAEPTGSAIQKFCIGATIADLAVTGTDIKWYSNSTSSSPLALNAPLVDQETYYASQTIDACESETRLAVTVDVKDVAPLPTGPTNQDYVQGETLLDLTVTGDNLIWYMSTNGLQFTEVTDPSQIVLTDQTTYYVTQTPNGFCESDKLPITVHRVVGLDHPNFEGLVYYPNPVRDYLSITNRKAIESVVVYNLLGQQVVSENLNSTEATIDMSYLAAGPYMVKITVEERSTMVKIIKE